MQYLRYLGYDDGFLDRQQENAAIVKRSSEYEPSVRRVRLLIS